MTTPTGGNDIAQLGISVRTDGAVQSAKELDGVTDSTVKTVKSLGELRKEADTLAKEFKKLQDSGHGTKEQIRELQEAVTNANKAVRLAEKAIADTISTNTRFIATLERTVAELNKTEAELLRMRAAELGVANEAERLITVIERQSKSLNQLEYAAFRTMEAQEQLYLKTAKAAEYSIRVQMEAEEAASLRRQALRKADEVALQAHVAKEIELNRNLAAARERAANAQMAANDHVAQKRRQAAEDAIKHAEKQAMEEIRWAQMSAKAKYDELVKLQAYQSNPAIRQTTIDGMFSKAAQNDIHNTQKYLKEYEDTLNRVRHGHNEAGRNQTFAQMWEQLRFGAARARAELIVIAHEIVTGRFSRIPGSLMVLAEYTNMSAIAMSGLGLGLLGVAAAAVVMLAAVAGAEAQVKKLNDALNRSNAVSGLTTDGLNQVAQAAGKVHSNYSDAYEASAKLAASGKFTAEQLGKIIPVVTEMAHYFGGSLNDSIKEFESLIIRSSTKGIQSQLGVSRALLDLNDKYHFVNATQMQHLLNLEKEGKMREASAYAITLYTEEGKRASTEAEKYMGTLLQGWHNVLGAIQRAKQALFDWGAVKTLVSQEEEQVARIDRANDPMNISYNFGDKRANTIADAEAKLFKIRVQMMDLQDAELEKGKKQFAQDEANNVLRMRQIEVDTLMRRTKGELTYALEKFNEQNAIIAAADPTYMQKNAKFLKEYEENLRRIHAERKPKTPGEGANLFSVDTSKIDRELAVVQDTIGNNERLIKEALSAKVLTEENAYAQMRGNREDELESINKWYQDRKALIAKFEGKMKPNDYRKAVLDLSGDYNKKIADSSGNMSQIKNDQLNSEQKAYDSLIEKIDSANEKELDRLDKAISKQRDHNEAIGRTDEQQQIALANRDAALAATNEREVEALRLVLGNEEIRKSMTSQDVALYEARIAYLDRVIAKQKELSGLHVTGADKEANSPEKYAKDALKAAQQWQQAGNTIGDSLTKAFGKGGKAAGDMFKSFAQGQARQLELNKDLVKERAAADLMVNKERMLKQADDKYNAQTARNNMNMYGDMAGAAAGFFDEQSKGYKALMTVSQVFHAAELAMSIAELVPKATAAILNQGNGDPYTAFGRMAAMAAIVAGLGVAVGAIGGSAPASTQDSKTVQKSMGTGTVFGDDSEKSESLIKSFEALQKNSSLMLPLTNQMAMYLRNIDGNTKSLANIVMRSMGITDGSNLNITTGDKQNGQKIVDSNVFFGGIGPMGQIMGALSSAILGKTKTSITDSGLQFGGSVGDLQNGQGISQYANVHKDKKSFFGLIKSSSDELVSQDADAQIKEQFGLVFTNLEKVLVSAGVMLGKEGNIVSQAVKGFVLDLTKISFKDLKGQELQDAINNVLSAAADKITEAAFPSMGAFRQVGEGYAETIIRVATGVELAEYSLKKLGITAINYTDILNKQGDVGAEIIRQSVVMKEAGSGVGSIINEFTGGVEDMIALYDELMDIRKLMKQVGTDARQLGVDMIQGAGGLEALKTGFDSYFQNFFSSSEQNEAKLRALTEQFAALGQVLPASKDGFRTLVESIDQTTAAGRALYGALIALAPQISDVELAVNKLADSQKAYLDASATANAALDSAASAYQGFVDAVTTAEKALADVRASVLSNYLAAVAAEKSATDAVQVERDKLTDGYVKASQKVLDLQAKMNDALLKTSENLKVFLKSLDATTLGGGSREQRLAATRTQFSDTLSKASTDSAAADKLPELARALLQLERESSKNEVEYMVAVARVRNSIQDVVTAIDTVTAQGEKSKTSQEVLDEAIQEQARWADAVRQSGASFTQASGSLLGGYNKAVEKQEDANTVLEYWAGIAEATGTVITGNLDALLTAGGAAIAAFDKASTDLTLAQAALAAANIVKGDLELRQVTALEAFIEAIANVNTTAKDALDAATQLFKDASSSLGTGGKAAQDALNMAKDGMEYWGDIVKDSGDALNNASLEFVNEATDLLGDLSELLRQARENGMGVGNLVTTATTAADRVKLAIDAALSAGSGLIGTAHDNLVTWADAALAAANSIRDAAAALDNANTNTPGTTPSQNAAIEAMIISQYGILLERLPDAMGMDFWKDRLAEGVTLEQFSKAIRDSNEYKVRHEYETLLGRDADPAGLQFWVKQLDEGNAALDEVSAAIKESTEYKKRMQDLFAIPGFASGGLFRGGLRIVGENGPELEATGESRIWSNSDTRSMLSNIGNGRGGSDNREVIAELRSLKQEVTILRKEQREGDLGNIRATKANTRILTDLTEEGTSMSVTVVNP